MDLLKQVLNPVNLGNALHRVISNGGSAGVDGMEVPELRKYMQKHQGEIIHAIGNGTYQPQMVKGIEIPKLSGGKRLLGIPTVADRMIQQAIHQVLCPLYDVEFSAFSYGFRPNKGAHQAIYQSLGYINTGYQDIIDLDLKRTTIFIEQELKLKVNTQKTSICRPINFHTLGYNFVSTYEHGKKGQYRLRVSPKRFNQMKQKVKEITRKTRPLTFSEGISELNSYMKGWIGYFRYAFMQGKPEGLDAWIRNRLRYCIWKHWKKPNKRMRSYIRMGIPKDMAYAWSRPRMGGWAQTCSPMMKTTVTVQRLKQGGYIEFSKYYQRFAIVLNPPIKF